MTAVRRIGIAVVRHADLFLVGTRPDNVPLAGYAEFPGGKCRIGELPVACAVRECFEETGLAVEPVSQLATIPWSYPHGDVELHFWLCHCVEIDRDAAPPTPAPAFRWLPRKQLQAHAFPPANASVIEQLLVETPSAETVWSITVRFFAAAQEAAGTDTCLLPVPPGCQLKTVQDRVLHRYPNLQKFAASLLWAVNNHYANSSRQLQDGAVVACFPPVSGG